jgi:hypothetical protein
LIPIRGHSIGIHWRTAFMCGEDIPSVRSIVPSGVGE